MRIYKGIKTGLGFSFALTLGLLACQSPEQSLPTSSVTPPTPSVTVAEKPALSARAKYDPQTRALQVNIQTHFQTNHGFSTQALPCGDVDNLKVSVQGIGIEDNAIVQNVAATGCTGSGLNVTLNNVPVGKSRVLVIQAQTAGNQDLPGMRIMAAFDLDNAAQTIAVDQSSTVLADVLRILLSEHGQPGAYLMGTADLNSGNANSLGQFVSEAVTQASATGHPRLVDTHTLAEELVEKDGDIASMPAASTFVQSSANANITLTGPDDTYSVIIRDPLSSPGSVLINGDNPTATLSTVLPGTWLLEIRDSTAAVVNSQTVTLTSGDALNLAVNLSGGGGGSLSPAWQMLEGPEGGSVSRLMQVAGGSTWLAGTSQGIYRTGNINNVNSGSPWAFENGLTNKKVLSLLESQGTLYAGVNAGELFNQTGTDHQGVYIYNSLNSTWEPDNNPNLTNIDVYDLLEGNSNVIYGATSDGVIENNGAWSKVNGPASILAGRRLTDIEFDGFKYFVASPDSNQVFEASTPASTSAGGWITVGNFDSGSDPTSISTDGSEVWAGGRNGSVYAFDGESAWNPLGVSQPGAAITELHHHLDGSSQLRLIATTNGAINTNPPAGVQSITNMSSPSPPFSSSESWNELGVASAPLVNPFVRHFQRIPGVFDGDELSGLLVGTAGAGVSQSVSNAGNTNNASTGTNDVDWLTLNTGLVASDIKDIVRYTNGTDEFYYVATRGHGVHRYSGGTWTHFAGLVDGNPKALHPESVTVDNNGTLYVAYDTSVSILQQAHTATATDAWTMLSGPAGEDITDMVYAAASNRLVAAQAGGGSGSLTYSTACPASGPCTLTWSTGEDGGGNITGDFYTLSVSPANSDVLYAGKLEDLYKSTNGGANWVSLDLLTSGLPLSAGSQVKQLTVAQSGANPSYVYFTVTNALSDPALYLYFNNGSDNWLDLSTAAGLPAETPLAIAVQADAPDHLVVSMPSGGVYVSEDATSGGSSNFSTYNADDSVSPPVPTAAQMRFNALLLHPDVSGYTLLGGSQGRGLYKSPF